MSKNRSLLLLFLFIGLISVQIMPAKAADIAVTANLSSVSANGSFIHAAGTIELLSKNYTVLKTVSKKASAAPKDIKVMKVMKMLLTAYSSCVDETDDTPFITASGNYVRPGVVASNFLPFGTKILIPKLFGGRIFTVEDRLRSDYNDRVDIWFPSKEDALNFGAKITEIEVL